MPSPTERVAHEWDHLDSLLPLGLDAFEDLLVDIDTCATKPQVRRYFSFTDHDPGCPRILGTMLRQKQGGSTQPIPLRAICCIKKTLYSHAEHHYVI